MLRRGVGWWEHGVGQPAELDVWCATLEFRHGHTDESKYEWLPNKFWWKCGKWTNRFNIDGITIYIVIARLALHKRVFAVLSFDFFQKTFLSKFSVMSTVVSK